jgi:hypothetical protein
MIRAWRERRRVRAVERRALVGLATTALHVSSRIEQTAASFGSDRLFDPRFGQIELDAVMIRDLAREAIARGAADSHEEPS